jgi:hypothetical protein
MDAINKAAVAPEICGIGYCESKNMFYYGMKLTFW